MKKLSFRNGLLLCIPVLLALSFWYSAAWLRLCYGLALFLFGMQCIEEGLHNAAGGVLERLMSRCTATPKKGLLFGLGATFVLQSSTLVSLLTIAFLSTGLITLAGGIAVILGTNLGATSGIWLLAAAGQSISLAPVAVPMLVFGLLGSFFNGKTRALGRVLIGISLIFMGIDAIKDGFQVMGGQTDFSGLAVGGIGEIALFCGIGLLLTIVLQSSHATLILTLSALSGGQIQLMQAFALAVGSNVGSSVSTAFVGMLGSDRSGQRLALAHLLFNVLTAVLSLLLWWPLSRLVVAFGGLTGMGALMQLALFHTLFNLLGLAVFWPLQEKLAAFLVRRLPERRENAVLPDSSDAVRARYLNDNVLRSGDTALCAIRQEVGYLNRLGLEALCHVLFVPAEKLYGDGGADTLSAPALPLLPDAQARYESQIKPLYSDLLDFTGRTDIEGERQQQMLAEAHAAAWRMVEMVKDGKHLQKNMRQYLETADNPVFKDYMTLRQYVFTALLLFRQTIEQVPESAARAEKAAALSRHTATLAAFRARVLAKLRSGRLSGWHTSSLLNDIHYAERIAAGLAEIAEVAQIDRGAA